MQLNYMLFPEVKVTGPENNAGAIYVECLQGFCFSTVEQKDIGL